ncbi:MAG TPA: hypothetical protein VMW33_14305 [Ilumatobacteraceae bacterium]|nr:hypothetical protein [Ilumatobacteraceae bacterium]
MSDRWDELCGLEFSESYPTPEASERLVDEMMFQRACQVVLWSIPAMSVYAMKKGSDEVFGAGGNVLVVFKDRLTAKTVISTPNSDGIMQWADLPGKPDTSPVRERSVDEIG